MNESAIQEVMQQFGMDYIQARNHLKCQASLRTGAKPSAIAPVTRFRIELEVGNVKQPSDCRIADGSTQNTKG